VGIIQHQEFGAYLIDAGLDKSYVHNPHGTIRGLMVKSYLGKGSQEPNTHIAAILNQESIQLEGVFLTHLHTDHTAGIVDLAKDIPYVAGKNERYINFRFFMQSEHLAGIDELHEIDFATGIELPPLAVCRREQNETQALAQICRLPTKWRVNNPPYGILRQPARQSCRCFWGWFALGNLVKWAQRRACDLLDQRRR
jgi:hypothetical protein